MVDLPTIPDNIPEVRAPQPRVSPSEIAQPFMELGANLDKAGQTVSRDIAVPLAQQAGLTAVARDQQGNLTVDRPPLVGDAAVAFSRAVKFSALAQAEGEAKRQDLLLSKQFHNDPDGYLKATQAYRNELVQQYTQAAGPEVGISLGRSIDSATTYNYRWLLLEQQRTIKHNFDHDTQAAIKSKEEDLFSLIEQGGLDTEDGRQKAQQLINERIAITHERVTNPVLAAPAGVAAVDLKSFDERVGAAKFGANINKILHDERAGGVDVARQVVDSVMQDGSLTPTQRAYNHAFGTKIIKDYTDNLARTAHASNVMQKQVDQLFEDAVIRDSASAQPKITLNDVKTNPDASPAAKMRMEAWLKQDGKPEPLGRVSELTTQDAFRRMNLPEGDPTRINSVSQIHELYAPPDGSPGRLTRRDHDWLSNVFTQAKSPEGEPLARERNQFFKNFQGVIDPSLGTDPKTSGNMYLAIKDAQRQEEALRSQGKDPHLVYDPRSPEFFGNPKNLQKYQRPLDQILRDYQQQTPAVPQPGDISEGYRFRGGDPSKRGNWERVP